MDVVGNAFNGYNVCVFAYGQACSVASTFVKTRKYSLRGYILGVLTHTTARDQQWGGDATLECI